MRKTKIVTTDLILEIILYPADIVYKTIIARRSILRMIWAGVGILKWFVFKFV